MKECKFKATSLFKFNFSLNLKIRIQDLSFVFFPNSKAQN